MTPLGLTIPFSIERCKALFLTCVTIVEEFWVYPIPHFVLSVGGPAHFNMLSYFIGTYVI